MNKTITSILIIIGIFLIAFVIYKKGSTCHKPPGHCSENTNTKRELHLAEDKEEANKLLNSYLSLNIDDTLSYQPLFISMKRGKSFTLFARVSSTIGKGKDKRVNGLKFALGNGDGSHSTIASVGQPIRKNDTIDLPLVFSHHQCDAPYIPKVIDYTIDDAANYIKQGDLILHPKTSQLRISSFGKYEVKLYQVGDHVCGTRAHQPSMK